MEQKTVKIIGFRAEKNGIIKVAVLTPDILAKKLIVIKGDSGNGKSTLIDGLRTAVSGTDAIKKKDILENGFIDEAILLDGDIQLYVGAKVDQYQKGEKAGENKFIVFLYAKDANGKAYTPIIDGVTATAGKYVDMLTTELTFNMPALFSENQTIHRGLIEKLFKAELDALGADEVVSTILKAKTKRDSCRTLCQSQGAYMEQFEAQGLTEVMLASIKSVDVKAIDEKITQKRIELDRMVNGSDTAYQLEVEKLKTERNKALQVIKDEVLELREKIRKDGEEKQTAYNSYLSGFNQCKKGHEALQEEWNALLILVDKFLKEEKGSKGYDEVHKILFEKFKERDFEFLASEPTLEPIDSVLSDSYATKSQEYLTLESTPLATPVITATDTASLDADIAALDITRKAADDTNALYNKFQMWQNWIEAQHDYEKQIDILRAMYERIDCGVEGMHIVPTETESGRVEVWIQYDGSYDTDFYHNENKEMRFIFQYSSFQRAAIGVMLQAARLNLKSKALRLAIVDDVAFTEKGLAVLAKMCEDFNVQLITSKTDDYDKTNIGDGEIIMENGEIFFNK